MYSINNSIRKKGKIEEIYELTGFPMGSHHKVFKIKDSNIKEIKISNATLASPIVTEKVLKKYHSLIEYLAELFVDDDDSGDTMREILNQIEKFRLEIKVKYRDYLKRKEIEMMSKQLLALQKEAKERLLQIHNSYAEMIENKRSK